jgi:hypothetical protein
MKKRILYHSPLPVMVMLISLIMASCSTDDQLETEQRIAEKFQNEENLKNSQAEQNKLLAQIRRATAKYQRLEVAEADGYVLDDHCVSVPGLGGMGHHAANFALVGVDFDPLMPQVLLYEPLGNGKYNLVGVEYIVIDAGQDHPHLGNQPFDVGGTPIPDDHYSLHVWIWKANPSGMYFPFNPNVSCEP